MGEEHLIKQSGVEHARGTHADGGDGGDGGTGGGVRHMLRFDRARRTSIRRTDGGRRPFTTMRHRVAHAYPGLTRQLVRGRRHGGPCERSAGDGERDSSHAVQTGPKRRGEQVGEESGAVAIYTASEAAAAGITAL